MSRPNTMVGNVDFANSCGRLRAGIREAWGHLEFFRTCPRTRDQLLVKELRQLIRGHIATIRKIERGGR